MPGRPRVVGFLVEKEVKYLSEAARRAGPPVRRRAGRGEGFGQTPAITNLMDKADHILIGGAMAYTFIKALGYETGNSRIDEEHLADAKRMIDHSADHHVDLHLPSDHICSTEFSENLGSIEVFEDQIKPGFMGLDIGPRTQSHYATVIRKAKTVVWNGPMGVFSGGPFASAPRPSPMRWPRRPSWARPPSSAGAIRPPRSSSLQSPTR